MPKLKRHPFVDHPHRTLLGLMFPVLLSLIAEPFTGLADTAFIAQLGTEPLAGLGVATIVLSTMFWIFNFLDMGTQTSISQATGAGESAGVRDTFSLALTVAWVLGVLVATLGYTFAGPLAGLLGGTGGVRGAAAAYIQVRALGAPAVFTTMVCFGTLRGLQDMRTPSFVAVGVNVLNIVLDPLFIFGLGTFPAMGVAGAALASVIAQVVGAGTLLTVTLRRYGYRPYLAWGALRQLFAVGGNLFLRSGMITLFLLVATRVANQISPEAGAAHQVIRQVYVFTALTLDAFAISTQSLVGYFIGGRDRPQARRAATLSVAWSVGTGAALTALLLALTRPVAGLMVPVEAVAIFIPAWIVSSLSLPLNAIAFATDGAHLGAADFAFLRNATTVSTGVAVVAMFLIPQGTTHAFTWLWACSTLWVLVRSGFGLARIYLQAGRSPLSPQRQPA